ncbi:hypothetical protein [Dokdonia pacifica]|nr:hypothetical protein [Dokdonia pacifica]
MKDTTQLMYTTQENVTFHSSTSIKSGDCGYFMGDGTVCTRCGVRWVDHS